MLGFGDSSGRKRQQQFAELAGETGEFRAKLSPLSLRCPNWHVSNMVQTASSVHVVPGYLRHAHDDCRGRQQDHAYNMLEGGAEQMHQDSEFGATHVPLFHRRGRIRLPIRSVRQSEIEMLYTSRASLQMAMFWT